MTPPENLPPEQPPLRMVLLPWRNIVRLLTMGFFANVASSLVGSLLVAVIFITPLLQKGLSQNEAMAQLIGSSPYSIFYLTINTIGLISSMVGGFVVGKMAKQQELLYAAMLAILILILSVVSALFASLSKAAEAPVEPSDNLPWLFLIALAILEIIFTIQGGAFAKKLRLQNRLHNH